MRAAITGAPELLFVAAAGNSDDDSEFTAGIPNSIEAPNLLVVGAVDRSGQLSGFSTQGKQVRIYANGERVPARLPGGERLPVDGTSIAAPAVTALAGQLFALDPTLTPADVIRLILDGASKSEDGKRLLLDPKHSVELLRNRMRGAAP